MGGRGSRVAGRVSPRLGFNPLIARWVSSSSGVRKSGARREYRHAGRSRELGSTARDQREGAGRRRSWRRGIGLRWRWAGSGGWRLGGRASSRSGCGGGCRRGIEIENDWSETTRCGVIGIDFFQLVVIDFPLRDLIFNRLIAHGDRLPLPGCERAPDLISPGFGLRPIDEVTRSIQLGSGLPAHQDHIVCRVIFHAEIDQGDVGGLHQQLAFSGPGLVIPPT